MNLRITQGLLATALALASPALLVGQRRHRLAVHAGGRVPLRVPAAGALRGRHGRPPERQV